MTAVVADILKSEGLALEDIALFIFHQANLRNTEGRLDFQRVEPNIWMPTDFELKLNLNVMLVKNIRRLIKKWTDYKQVSRTIVFNNSGGSLL
jgi:hypothetical protein